MTKLECLLELARASAMLNEFKGIQDNFCARYKNCSGCPIDSIFCLQGKIDATTRFIDNAYFKMLQPMKTGNVIWHDKTVEAETQGVNDEVSLIVWRNTGGTNQIEWIPYCPRRDGTWDDFVYCFRVLRWCYERDLFEQAESEAQQ